MGENPWLPGVGSAGSAEKVWFLREECGFEGAFRLFEGKNVGKMVVRLA